MAIGSFGNPLVSSVATLMITPHGTSQAPSKSKTANPREASPGHAPGRELVQRQRWAHKDTALRSQPGPTEE
jgi:hypothetical protein